MGFMPAVEANYLLNKRRPGVYLIRFSKTKATALAATFVDGSNHVKHCLVRNSHCAVALSRLYSHHVIVVPRIARRHDAEEPTRCVRRPCRVICLFWSSCNVLCASIDADAGIAIYANLLAHIAPS